MKKTAIFMAVVAMIFVFTTCSINNAARSNPKNPVILTLMTYYNDIQLEKFKKKVAEFNETEGISKGIIVEVKSLGSISHINNVLIKSAEGISGSEEFPDMFITYKGIVPYLKNKVELVKYTQYFSKSELSKYNPLFLEEGKTGKDEELIMLPIGRSTDVIYVNKTDFDVLKHSLNITYEDLETYEGIVLAAEKYYNYTDSLTDTPNDGKALFSMDSVAQQFLSVLSAMGKEFILIENGEISVNFEHEAARKWWDIYYVPFIRGYFTKRGMYVSEDIKTGRSIVALASTSSALYMPDRIMEKDGYIRNIKMDVLKGPHLKDYNKVSVNEGGGIFVAKSTAVREYASIEFIKWFTEKENNLEFAVNASYMPVRADNTDKEHIEKKIHASGISSVVKDSIVISLQQKNDSKSFIKPDIDMYESVRDVVEKIFSKDIQNKRNMFLAQLYEGKDYDEIVSDYLSDKAYEEWRTNIIKEVEREIKLYRNNNI